MAEQRKSVKYDDYDCLSALANKPRPRLTDSFAREVYLYTNTSMYTIVYSVTVAYAENVDALEVSCAITLCAVTIVRGCTATQSAFLARFVKIL